MSQENKTTVHFKESIQKALDKKAETDSVFKEKLTNEKFRINDCVDYILTTVKNSKVQGYTDDEVFAMGIHYVDEFLHEDFKFEKGVQMQVVVNHTVKLTEKEIKEAKDKAKKKILNEAREQMTKKPKKKVVKNVDIDKKDKNKPTQSALLF